VANVVMARASERFRFRNYYRCPYDGTTWVDEWACTCNDRCPLCRAEIEPYDSEDINSEDWTVRLGE
jgi:transcription initiation factor IIE alpha subunit